MPIISKIGSKSSKVRMVYGTIYLVLIVGAVSMVYPFMLMISGSFTSETDFLNITPYPKFWFDDSVLFQKYTESKYNVDLGTASYSRRETVGSWRQVKPTKPKDPQLLEEYLAWRKECPMPTDWYSVGNVRGVKLQPINVRRFRAFMMEKFGNDLNAYVEATGAYAKDWGMAVPPNDSGGASRRCFRNRENLEKLFTEFKASLPLEDRILFNLDGIYWWFYLVPKYSTDIQEYNRRHGTSFSGYDKVFLDSRMPGKGLCRQDWDDYVRNELNLHFIRLDASLAEPYRKFLEERYKNIGTLNSRFHTQYVSFEAVPFPTTVPINMNEAIDWELFIKDSKVCDESKIEVYGPRQSFEEYVAKQRHVSQASIAPLTLPTADADFHDTLAHAKALRWEFSTRNYRQVLDHLIIHGRGLSNTLIYCTLAILTSMLVNPLAAYALSRYRPPSTYKILLFCMATMAFPGEVTMIPGFLLLKRFPLWQLVVAAVTFGVIFWLSKKIRPRWSERRRAVPALGAGLLLGFWAVPGYMLSTPNVSLLNTFYALILPGMANGYFIFLLKGFFDSLPPELYESADLDGASEWTKFWAITMSLSKPILAVIALGAFTSAYTAFMMALIIIPDPEMWTLMVWLFQLEQNTHQSVVYASLVIAAIPTFLVFACCQNIIMRGIIVPVEK